MPSGTACGVVNKLLCRTLGHLTGVRGLHPGTSRLIYSYGTGARRDTRALKEAVRSHTRNYSPSNARLFVVCYGPSNLRDKVSFQFPSTPERFVLLHARFDCI